MLPRKSWDQYFLEMAQSVAERSTCDRARVGAVLVSPEHLVISTGYNGSPPGLPHCDEVGHLMIAGHCRRTVHAEANALLLAGERARGGTLYVTHSPCLECQKLLIRAGVQRVVFAVCYRSAEFSFLIEAGISVVFHPLQPISGKTVWLWRSGFAMRWSIDTHTDAWSVDDREAKLLHDRGYRRVGEVIDSKRDTREFLFFIPKSERDRVLSLLGSKGRVED